MSRAHLTMDILIGFLARVGWEICPSCDGRGGTSSMTDVSPCGDCGGYCLVEIDEESLVDLRDEIGDWCNCQAIRGTPVYPGPWHPKGDLIGCPDSDGAS